jgi:hypothetical protein
MILFLLQSTPMKIWHWLTRPAIALLPLGLAAGFLAAQPPQTADALLQRMHDAYAGRWYQTLAFVQRTVIARAGGQSDTTIWYETLSGPSRLRIDIGPPAAGNGALFTAESTIVVHNGAVARAVDHGNPFLPLIMGVYLQPVAQTARELRPFGFDLARVGRSEWEGRPVVVVGTTDPADSASAQFWVDTERLVLVRMRGAINGIGNADIHVGGYVPVGPAWLATRIRIATGGQVQTEEYSDWTAGVAVSPALFDPAQWNTAPHWARKTLPDTLSTLFDSLSAIHRDHPDSGLLRRLHPPADTIMHVEGSLIESFTGDSLFRRVMSLHVPVRTMRQQFSQRTALLLDADHAILTAVEQVDWVDAAGSHRYSGLLTIAVSRRGKSWVIRAYRGT